MSRILGNDLEVQVSEEKAQKEGESQRQEGNKEHVELPVSPQALSRNLVESHPSPWKQVILCALRLTIIDVLWSIPLLFVGISIVVLRSAYPTNTFCILLKGESESIHDISIPKWSLAIEILVTDIFYCIPTMSCIMLLEDDGASVRSIVKNWWDVIKTTIFCSLCDTIYRVVMFFTFISPLGGKARGYPDNYNLLAHFFWVVSSFIIVKKACHMWTAKQIQTIVQQTQNDYMNKYQRLIEKELEQKVLCSVILTALCGSLLEFLSLSVFQVSQYQDRALLIVIVVLIALPIQIIIDQRARKPFPWSLKAKSMLASTTHSFGNVKMNRYVLSIFVIAAMCLIVRGLQANMTTLKSKLLTGLMATCVESIFTIVRPYFFFYANQALESTRERISSHISNSSQIFPFTPHNTPFQHDAIPKNIINPWHRGYIIIILNRLEMFSILFGNGLVMMAIFVRDRALDWSSNIEDLSHSRECNSVNTMQIAFEALLLCLLESVVEFVTYVYMIRVERLPLDRVLRRKRLNVSLFCFVITNILFFVNEFLAISFSVLSCENVDEYLYRYQCTSF